MEERGFIVSHYGKRNKGRGGHRKKFYILSALGKRLLTEQYAKQAEIYQRTLKIYLR